MSEMILQLYLYNYRQLEQNACFCSSIVVNHQSRREYMKITVKIKVMKWHNENLLTLTLSNKLLNNYVAVKLFHMLNT